MVRREPRKRADEIERRGGLIYEEESTATQGRAGKWESEGGQGGFWEGAGGSVAGVGGGQGG